MSACKPAARARLLWLTRVPCAFSHNQDGAPDAWVPERDLAPDVIEDWDAGMERVEVRRGKLREFVRAWGFVRAGRLAGRLGQCQLDAIEDWDAGMERVEVRRGAVERAWGLRVAHASGLLRCVHGLELLGARCVSSSLLCTI